MRSGKKVHAGCGNFGNLYFVYEKEKALALVEAYKDDYAEAVKTKAEAQKNLSDELAQQYELELKMAQLEAAGDYDNVGKLQEQWAAIKETVKTPRQECRNVSVTHRRPVQDENRIAGSVLGAVAGGVIGHQFGGGRGKDVATVVGALGGGYAGNQVQGAMQDNDTYTTTQQRCKTVYDKSEKMLGYDVTYKIGDQQGKIRMDKDPGTQIPLDGNGQLVLNNKV